MKENFILLLVCIVLSSCTNQKPEVSVDPLLEIETAFSDMSREKGMVEAFTFFADDEVVLLRPESYPIIGKNELIKSLEGVADSTFSLTWKVTDAQIAKSGDLGYTFGIYTMKLFNESGIVSKGTYVTIWKKNEEGEWKYVLDTGQDGLGEE
jgi:ketosteroid isomerase-like protein